MFNFSNVATIYVSQSCGKQYNSGFSAEEDGFGNGPLPSIEEALFKVYQLRSAGGGQPVTIKLTDDEYYLDKTVELDYQKLLPRYKDHGSISGITFDGCGKKIVGGMKITGFKPDTFNGQNCFSVFVPEIKEGLRFTDLYVDGRRTKMTRFPKEGTLRCITTERTEGDLRDGSKWFVADKADLNRYSNIEDAIISYYHYWIDEHTPVESYDRETGKLVMKYSSRFLISNKYDEEHNAANLEYYVENLAEMFENPDEWYVDNKTGMVYYIPRNEEQTAESMIAYVPKVSRMLDIRGTKDEKVCNIRFRNIDFICSKGDYASRSGFSEDEDLGDEPIPEDAPSYGSDIQSVASAYGAINLRFARNCSFESCSFENLGVHGVSVEHGCSDIRIENCRFYDIGAGGVRINGGSFNADEAYDTHHIRVSGCNISYCGRRYAAGCGILACHSYCNEFCDNEISYLDYSGISVGWVWGYQKSITRDNIIKRNHIHHIGMGNLSDMGGIYLLGSQPGTVVSDNVIHDIICRYYGGWGIYTDEGSSFMTIEGNTVYNASSDCYHQHYGSFNVVRDNVFAYGGNSVVRCSVPEMHSTLMLENNVMITDGKPVFSTCFADNGLNPGISSHHNRIYDKSGKAVMFEIEGKKFSLEDAKKMGLEQESREEKIETDFAD